MGAYYRLKHWELPISALEYAGALRLTFKWLLVIYMCGDYEYDYNESDATKMEGRRQRPEVLNMFSIGQIDIKHNYTSKVETTQENTEMFEALVRPNFYSIARCRKLIATNTKYTIHAYCSEYKWNNHQLILKSEDSERPCP